MLRSGEFRQTLARTLRGAYGDGLLNEATLAHPGCDIVLADPTVSRRHGRRRFGDGIWRLRDLESINGTQVNRTPVGRCQLHRADRVRPGDEQLLVD